MLPGRARDQPVRVGCPERVLQSQRLGMSLAFAFEDGTRSQQLFRIFERAQGLLPGGCSFACGSQAHAQVCPEDDQVEQVRA